ncbi:sulfatase family protein [Persicobacter psychrovividus]|uniref:Arylsulfatase n=1 Tax=Persicobacter psychrovividus TaxID=387638 RepID=A0ABN6LFT2_9BACT|nr:arylsulfatase [Persicobacter psychrovividus]
MKILLIVLNFLVTLPEAEKGSKQADKPNIVVLLCDDLGYGDLGVFGHPIIDSPNLDKIAKQGIILSDCYSAAPVCSPSRAGLLTGRSPNRAGLYDFIPSPKRSEDCRDLVHLQQHEQTIPAMLKQVGYATCLSGKWHCSSRFNSNEQPKPNHFGFDHWFATHNNAAPSHANPKNFVRNGEPVGELEGFSAQIVVKEAIDWLENQPENQPFYLQVTFHEPHEPIASPKKLVEKYLPMAENVDQAEYFANVENMDRAVGQLYQYLESKELNNTLIFFSSDNGPETLMRHPKAIHSYGSAGELKGMKLWTNEAGFRVPGIIHWMGKKTYTGQSDAVVSSLDLMPTFAALTGAPLPDNGLDGESFAQLLATGKKERQKPLIWAFYDAINQQRVAMRTEKWKLLATLKVDGQPLERLHNLYDGNIEHVKNAELMDFELYDIRNDMSESVNVATKFPEQFKALKAQMKEEYQALLENSHVWNREATMGK